MRDPRALSAAILLGILAAVFVSGYFLIDLLPPESRSLQLATLGIGLLAAAGYALLLPWLRMRLLPLSRMRRSSLLLICLVLGGFIFLGGTDRWRASGRYISFLLPIHQLQLSVIPSPESPGVALAWFKTSLGDVSFDAIQATGWKRQAADLTVDASSLNALKWTGRTGEDVQLVLHGGRPGTRVLLEWDGAPETLTFAEGRINYERSFPVPLYASASLIIFSGWISFAILMLALMLLIIERQLLSMPAIERAFTDLHRPLDRLDGALILVAICLALLLRCLNLENVFPAVDEYYHLIAAQQIVHGAALDAVYPRGLWLATVPISLALRVFGHQLWAARLVGVLFNVAAVVPLYLLARKINRPVAALSSLLYASSPWIITFARVAREYAFYPFYFYGIVYAMVMFVSGIPAACVVLRDWKELVRPRMLILAALLVLPPVFAVKIDWLSTFRTILIAYLVFGAFVLGRLDWKARTNWPILAVLGGGLILGGRAGYLEQIDKVALVPRLNTLPLEYFLPNPQQQWYFDRVVILAALALIGAATLGYLLRRINFVPLFMLALFGGYLAVFTLVSRTFFHTRHLLTTQLWFVPVIATGMYVIWGVIKAFAPASNNLARIGLMAVLGALVLNVPQILLPSLSRNPDMPISEDYLHDLSQVQAFMLGHAQPSDVLISTVYGLYATWEQQPVFAAQHRITSQTPKEDIFSIVDQNTSGWIVIDKIRLDLSGLSMREITGAHQIEYIGIFGDEYVWHWQRFPTGAGWRPVMD